MSMVNEASRLVNVFAQVVTGATISQTGTLAGPMAASSPPEHDPERCTSCRGTGQVVSALGGEAHDVPCPWCGGTGRRDASRDAQQYAPADPAGSAER
jgi:DnaJ-class molecular chaperone